MVKNIYLDTKINLLQCKGAELHLEVTLDHAVGIVLGVSGSSETNSHQLSIVKNIYLNTKINLLQCKGAELHLEVALDHDALQEPFNGQKFDQDTFFT